jgi:hypothetical protein
MKEFFIASKFFPKTLDTIDQANAILAEYDAQGFTLTLRQLFYQFVARVLIENKQTKYDRLGETMANARRAGLVDWEHIEDRTRDLQVYAAYSSPAEVLQEAANQYRRDLWATQKYRPESWIEKSALIGVIEPACGRWRVPHIAARGYPSVSELYAAGKRFADYAEQGYRLVVFYLGDHDPSGLDMSRSLREELSLYARAPVDVRRIALNLHQVRELGLPPNPAKESDGRFAQYVEEIGAAESWELDALSPTIIDALLDRAIRELVDGEAWGLALRREERERTRLAGIWDAFEAEDEG